MEFYRNQVIASYIICGTGLIELCAWTIDAYFWGYSSTSWLGEWMELITFNFITRLYYNNNALPRENEIKKDDYHKHA